jgi:hypothetical protein
VTRRFLRAIQEEQEQRRNNPAIRHAAGESLPRTFLEVARHRLPGPPSIHCSRSAHGMRTTTSCRS